MDIKRGMLLVLIVSIVFISGCKEPSSFQGIPSAKIPGKCIEAKDDICELFDCMVDLCWCDDANFPSPILFKGDTEVSSEEEAMQIVRDYIESLKFKEGKLAGELVERKVERAVELNDIFYNVFCDAQGEEEVYTVAVDGTIIKTICGV